MKSRFSAVCVLCLQFSLTSERGENQFLILHERREVKAVVKIKGTFHEVSCLKTDRPKPSQATSQLSEKRKQVKKRSERSQTPP